MTPPADSRRGNTPDPEDELTFAGNVPLGRRWWWSPMLMVVVGVIVVVYQVSAYTGEGGGFWLNGVMMAIGAAVAGAGVVSLLRAWRHEQARKGTQG